MAPRSPNPVWWSSERDGRAATLQPRVKVWFEADGRLLLSDFRVGLLEQVEETGSLAAAAAQLGLSYRRAWGKIKELEVNLGTALVASTAGGKRGGATRLTPAGRRLVRCYRAFRSRAERAVAEAFAAAFLEGVTVDSEAATTSTAEDCAASPGIRRVRHHPPRGTEVVP